MIMNNYWKNLADTDTYLNNNIADTIKSQILKNLKDLQSKFEVINEKLK